MRWVARRSGIEEGLGVKGESGMLASMGSRAAFLSDPSHQVVFHDTPKQSSWPNQIEIWLSILVRKLLKRGSFTSVEDLQARVCAFIGYYNRTMARVHVDVSGKAFTADTQKGFRLGRYDRAGLPVGRSARLTVVHTVVQPTMASDVAASSADSMVVGAPPCNDPTMSALVEVNP